jgi:hypothetical protein
MAEVFRSSRESENDDAYLGKILPLSNAGAYHAARILRARRRRG